MEKQMEVGDGVFGKPLHVSRTEWTFITIMLVGLVVFIPYYFFESQLQIEHVSYTSTLFIHSTLELLNISIALSIFFYGWNVARVTNSPILLLVAFCFLGVATFDILHTFSYEGMPFFVASTMQTSIWFWLLARMIEAVGLIYALFFLKSHNVPLTAERSTIWAIIGFLLIVIISFFVLTYSQYLPVLFVEGGGTTTFKNGIEYIIVFIHTVAIVIFGVCYRQQKNIIYLSLIGACFYLILCGLMATEYVSIYLDSTIVIHVFKVIGYSFILVAFYHGSIKIPLENKKMAETKLQDVQSELELLFENSADAIVIYQKDLSIIRCNDGFKNMFGYEEDSTFTVASIIPDELMEEFHEMLNKLDAGVPIVNFQTKRQRQDKKKMIDISITTSTIKSNGQILYAAILRDISEQKKTEFEIVKARRELQETMALHNGIIFKVKKVDDRFIHTLIDGKLLRSNDVSPENMIGKELRHFLFEEYVEVIETHYKKAWNGEECVFQIKFREIFVFLLHLQPMYHDGEICEIIGTCSDITTAIKTEELLRKTEKLSVVGELAAGFAHEIRNPLTTIKGFLQLVNKQSDNINNEYMTIMLNEIDRLEIITNEFMAVAKPEIVHFQRVDMNELILKVNRFLKPQALLNNIELVTEHNTNMPYVYADVNQLRQVFINIYKNAMEAMPDGGEVMTIISVTEDDCVTISVIDQGCGIPAHIIPKLGEPFYTLKEKGTGLGLMVTKKIIENHKGNLEIDSKENVGTTMIIKIPVFKG